MFLFVATLIYWYNVGNEPARTLQSHYIVISALSLPGLSFSLHVTQPGRNIYNWIFGDILVLRNCYQPRSHTEVGRENQQQQREERRRVVKLETKWVKANSQLVSWLVVAQFSNWPDVRYDGVTGQARQGTKPS